MTLKKKSILSLATLTLLPTTFAVTQEMNEAKNSPQGNNIPQEETAEKLQKPNIIYILADDAGVYDLGCYGQKIIKTPNIDKLAKEGMRFTQHYSGAPVCAPARGTLMTGKHTGHATIRDNKELKPEGQFPLKEKDITIGEILQKEGYTTATIGKWGLGGPNSDGAPWKQGFNYFYGYLCQRAAHNYYPVYLWENKKRVKLNNRDFSAHQTFVGNPGNPSDFEKYSGNDYAPDKMTEKVEEFIRTNKDNPFFLYWANPAPHVALQVPEDSLVQYENIEEVGAYLGRGGYLPHQRPRAAYAAMMSRMDGDIGKMMELLKELGIDDNTIIFFTSDNGPSFAGGADYEYFQSAGELRGLKQDLYEGGIRVPLIVRWNNKIQPESITDHISAFWDVLPTLTDIVGTKNPKKIDGISFLPTLLSQEDQKQHEYLYWEYGSKIKAIRKGDWKAVQLSPFGSVQLYNLAQDPSEKHNVARKNKELAKEMKELLKTARTPSSTFKMKGDSLFY